MTQELINRAQELDKLLLNAGNAVERAGSSYAAHMQLYNVAANAGDKESAEHERLALHTILDGILDAAFMIESMKNERQEIGLKLLHR